MAADEPNTASEAKPYVLYRVGPNDAIIERIAEARRCLGRTSDLHSVDLTTEIRGTLGNPLPHLGLSCSALALPARKPQIASTLCTATPKTGRTL